MKHVMNLNTLPVLRRKDQIQSIRHNPSERLSLFSSKLPRGIAHVLVCVCIFSVVDYFFFCNSVSVGGGWHLGDSFFREKGWFGSSLGNLFETTSCCCKVASPEKKNEIEHDAS